MHLDHTPFILVQQGSLAQQENFKGIEWQLVSITAEDSVQHGHFVSYPLKMGMNLLLALPLRGQILRNCIGKCKEMGQIELTAHKKF